MMPVTNENPPIRKRDSSHPVSFKEFQRLIVNLPEIALQLKTADGGSKTLNHWTRWYYEEFYRNPSIREQYPFKVAPCPGRTRTNLLRVPETATASESDASLSRPEASQLPAPESNAMAEENQLHPTPNGVLRSESGSSPDSHGVIVKVNKSGSFLFPVSFKTFERNLNKFEVFKRIVKSQDYLRLAADDAYRMQILRKFYHRFYMHPDKRSSKNLFKEVPENLLTRLLESGRPHDATAIKSMAEYNAKKALENKSVATFVLFKENVSNLSDIVEQMKQMDQNYEGKDFNECAFDFYLAFYITPEIREKYKYELLPGTSTMQSRMLAILSKKFTEELRQSLPQLASPSPALQLPEYKGPEKSSEKSEAEEEVQTRSQEVIESAQEFKSPEKFSEEAKAVSENKTTSQKAKESAEVPDSITMDVDVELPQLALPSKGPDQPRSTNPEKSPAKANKSKVVQSISMEVAVELTQIAISSPGLELPRSKTPERSPVNANNVNQVVETISMDVEVEQPQLSIPSEALELPRSSTPERSPAKASNVKEVVEIISVDIVVEPPQLAIRSPRLELPSSKTPERSPAKADRVNEILGSPSFETDVEVSIGKWGRFMFPVSYDTFRQYINYDEIIPLILKKHYAQDETGLKQLIADPSNPQCKKLFRQSYNRFYVHNEKFRKKIPYKFKCTDSKMLNKLLESAKPLDEPASKTLSLFAAEDKKNISKATEIQVTSPLEKSLQQSLPCQKQPDSQDRCTTVKPCEEGQEASSSQAACSSSNKVTEKTKDVSGERPQIPECAAKVDSHTDDFTDQKPGDKSHKNPVSFKVFRHHVRNLDEIASAMLLCPEYKGKSKESVIQEYYQGFYSGQEMRDKFVCRFKPCPSQMLEKLLRFPQNNKEVSSRGPECQDVCAPEKPSEESQEKPHSQAVFAIPRNVIPKRKESTQTTKGEKNETMTIANQSLFGNLSKSTLLASKGSVEQIESRNEQAVVKPAQISDECNAARILELNSKPEVDAVEFEAHNLFTYLFDGNTSPEIQASLKIQFEDFRLAQKEMLQSDTNPEKAATNVTKENDSVPKSNPMEVDTVSRDRETAVETQSPTTLSTDSKEDELQSSLKPPIVEEVQTNKKEIQDETSNNQETNLNSSKNASENNSREVPMRADGNPAVEPSLPQKTENEILLGQARDIFFAENDKDHNMRYMICTSQGLMRTIWRILYQLTLEEFSQYTSIHDAEALYNCDEDLQLCFRHVVSLGNWPINLYVRLGFLKQLLHSKGVQLEKLELSHISPKILSPWELGSYSDFDKIVEQEYTYHTGEIIDDVVQLCQEREKLYAACWTQNKWISRVPQIAEEVLNAEMGEADPSLEGISLRSICGLKSQDVNSPNEVVSIPSSFDTVCEETACPPTQLNSSNFIDVEGVDPASQVTQLADDPLTPEETVSETPPKEEIPTSTTLVTVKKEPISLPNNQRATLSQSDDCQWEEISSQEQVIDLDASQNEGSSLSCFAIPKPKEKAPEVNLNLIMSETDSETDENSNKLEVPSSKERLANAVPTRDQSKSAQIQIPVVLGKRRSPSAELASKRIKLVNEKVPQLRHEFQPLPIGVMVRIESGANKAPDCQVTTTPAEPAPNPQKNSTPQPEEAIITPSQDFAAGNTILECTQLQHLLDSTNVNTRQRLPRS
ncbi:protein telomere ends associated isoform X2 [Drosophila biarmipes]|uniref:protein telomere ends associated isoform X2 n=1 Tax=Drosophila biarmipes TaxID=125945 RepID=UPI001CDAC2A3|nr:protein telomere ends associated isoform X2 [Drosophila biarmipes]